MARVSVSLQLTSPNPEAARQIKAEAEQILKKLPGVSQVVVDVRQPASGQAARGSVCQPDQGAGRETDHRHGQRQGRRGQIHLLGESGLRVAASRRPRGTAGLRYLRPQHPLDDGRL